MTAYYHKGILAVAFGIMFLPSVFFFGAGAQERSLAHDDMHSRKLLILRHLARTGAVVPKLGEPQIGPPTGLHRMIRRRDDQITGSICSNCGPEPEIGPPAGLSGLIDPRVNRITGSICSNCGPEPEIGAPAGLNRLIEPRNNQITGSICSNCGP
jgi:predicted nucleic-acid-binding Zn-ribbon protein